MEYWSISGDAGDGVIVRCIRDTDGPYATAGSLMALVWNVGAWVEMLEVGSLYSALENGGSRCRWPPTAGSLVALVVHTGA